MSTTTTILDARLGAPIFVAPMGQQELLHPDAEVASAGAAAECGFGFILSIGSSCSLEEVAEVAGPGKWFQMYWLRDRGLMSDLVSRAEAAHYDAIVITVDVPVVGYRRRDLVHSAMGSTLARRRYGNFERYSADAHSDTHRFLHDQRDSSVTWTDLEWLQSLSNLPVVVKGLTSPSDARLALESGVAGIVVSNHGGRQLDHAGSTIGVLPEIVDVIQGKVPVLIDGGVRTASDIAIALCLGANAVALGRPVMWAMAIAGQAGVTQVFISLLHELIVTLALLGVRTPHDLDPSFIRRAFST